jgi:hypothetical protein
MAFDGTPLKPFFSHTEAERFLCGYKQDNILLAYHGNRLISSSLLQPWAARILLLFIAQRGCKAR